MEYKLVASPCLAEKRTKIIHNKSSYNNTNQYYNNIEYIEYKKRKAYRRALMQQKRRRAFFALCTALIMLIFIFSFVSGFVYKHAFLPIQNWGIKINIDNDFFHKSEALLTNQSLFGTNYLIKASSLEQNVPLMSPIPLGKEITYLKDRLKPILDSNFYYTAGFFVWDSKTHNYISINGDESFSAASMAKIPVLIELFRQIDQGIIPSINDEIVSKMYHLAGGSGELQYKPLNQKYSLDFIANKMITESDNTATNILLDKIGGLTILNNVMESWGIKNGWLHNWLPDLDGTNVMSPKDFATMLYNVKNPNFLSKSSADRILNYMLSVKNRHLISAGLPNGATLAHKTGDIGSMVGDAGIVTLPDGREIIIVAMVKRPWNSTLAKDMIREASRITIDYFYPNHKSISELDKTLSTLSN